MFSSQRMHNSFIEVWVCHRVSSQYRTFLKKIPKGFQSVAQASSAEFDPDEFTEKFGGAVVLI